MDARDWIAPRSADGTPGPTAGELPWSGLPKLLALGVRSYYQDADGIWRADLSRGHVHLGTKEAGALDLERLMRDPVGSVVRAERRNLGIQGRARPGLLVWDTKRGRTATVHFVRAPDFDFRDVGQRADFGLWTAGGFVGGTPRQWNHAGGLANRWIERIHYLRRPVEVKPRWAGPRRIVPTPYGFCIPEASYRFVHDFLACGDLVAAFRRSFPRLAAFHGNQIMKRAREALKEPTTYRLWVEEMGRALSAPESGMAAYIVEKLKETIEKTLGSREPWRAEAAIAALHEIARTNAQASAALAGHLEDLQATFGAPTGRVPIPAFVPTRQPSVAELANAKALGTQYLEDC